MRLALAVLVATMAFAIALPSPAAERMVRINVDAEADYNHIFPDLVRDPGDPSRLAAVAVKRLARGRDSFFGACLVHTSPDAGATWSTSALPLPAGTVCRRVPPPKLAFGGPGVLYAAYYALPETGTAGLPPQGRILVARSTDSGATFADPVPVTPAPIGRVAEAAGTSGVIGPVSEAAGMGSETYAPPHPQSVALAAAPGAPGGLEDVYVAWSVNRDRPFLWFSRSRDSGASFSEPAFLTFPKKGALTNVYSTQAWNDAYSVALAASGDRVFFTAALGACDSRRQTVPCFRYVLITSVSEDRGAAWSEPVQATEAAYYDTGATGAYPRPSIGVDPADPAHVYIVYDDSTRGSINYDVFLVRSGDGGSTWSEPVRVADDVADAGTPHQRPALSVAPNGRIDVAWYDGRHDPLSPESCRAFTDGAPPPCAAGRDVYLTSSNDHGATFLPNTRITPASFSAATRELDRNFGSVDAAIGSIGLVSTVDGAHLVWEQSRMVSTARGGTVAIWDLIAARVTR